MKKVLVTGASGNIGLQVIKSLLTESKYQITALDLKFKNSIKNFRKYNKRVNFVFGDVNDQKLINKLIKDKDIVIHLAAVMPPLANIKPELAHIINYEGTKTIVNAIKQINSKCFLLFASSSSVYGERNKNFKITIKDPIVERKKDYYAKTKIEAEILIKKELKNYSIFRVAVTLSNIKNDQNIFNLPLNSKLEMITLKDAAYAFTKAVDHIKDLKGKTFNLAGGEKCRTSYRQFLTKLLTIYGFNFRYLKSILIDEKNYYGGYYEDSYVLEDILHFQSDNLTNYYKKMKRKSKKMKRIIPKIFSYPIILFLKRKGSFNENYK